MTDPGEGKTVARIRAGPSHVSQEQLNEIDYRYQLLLAIRHPSAAP
jgi:hypothetical protein